jgi:hypothetical protein
VNEEFIGLAYTIDDRAVLEILVKTANFGLARHPSSQTWLQQALDEREIEIVECLLAHGVSILGCSVIAGCYNDDVLKCVLQQCRFLKERTDGMELLTVGALRYKG